MKENYPSPLPEWMVTIGVVGGLLFVVILLLCLVYVIFEVVTGESLLFKDNDEEEVNTEPIVPEEGFPTRRSKFELQLRTPTILALRRRKKNDDAIFETVQEAQSDFE